MNDTQQALLILEKVKFSWHASQASQNPVIDIAQMQLMRRERVFVRGASGSGKTTLLSLIAAVLKPQSGSIWIDGVNIAAEDAPQADRFRADNIGLVFQQFNLLPFLSVLENVQLPCRFSRLRRQRVLDTGRGLDEEAMRLLEAMQLPVSVFRNASAMQMSVGQQQRIAVARALIGNPQLIIADEPTSALDTDARDAFLKLLFAEVDRSGASLLFVSHDAALANQFDRQIDLHVINRGGVSQTSANTSAAGNAN